MAVNRLWFVFRDEGGSDCLLRNPSAGQEFPLQAGCAFFIPCNLEVALEITPSISFVSLHFDLELFYGFDVFDGSPRCEMLVCPELVARAQGALNATDELRAACQLNALIFQVCASWLPPWTTDHQRGQAAARKYAAVLEFVEREGDATTTVAALAVQMGLRNDVFSRTFTHDMGVTPKSFLSRSLMRKASRMLLTPETPVGAVARELRFSSPYYFSRFFKKHSGESPTEFRQGAGVGRDG